MDRIRRGAKDKFYACAFINFQYGVGEDKVSPPYTAETVDMRWVFLQFYTAETVDMRCVFWEI